MPVKIDYHCCNGCQRCYNICPMDVYAWDDDMNMPKVKYEEDCWHCGICWVECPKRAIDITMPITML